MKTPFLLTFLSASILLSGCSTSSVDPLELPIEPQSQYDQRIQDSLGSQRYTEAHILYQKRMNEFSDEMAKLDRQRKALENGLRNASLENGLEAQPASSAEADRIKSYQDAARQSQAEIARSDSEFVVKRALLENKRDSSLLGADRDGATKLADIEREYAQLTNLAEQASRELVAARRQQEESLQQQTNELRTREAALLDQQRFDMALANAEQVKRAQEALSVAKADLSDSQRQFDVEIAELESRLTALRLQATNTLASKAAIVAQADSELVKLAGVGEMLKVKPQLPMATSASESLAFQQFQIEQERLLADQKADIERRKQIRLAEVKSQIDTEKSLIISRTRTEIAGLESVATISKASVVAPVVTGRKVYTGDPKKDAVPSLAVKAQEPSKPFAAQVKVAPVTVAVFKPELAAPTKESQPVDEDVVIAGGASSTRAVAGAPIVQAPKSREVFDVLYVYTDKASWEKFQKYLNAYGVTDILPSHSSAKGEWYLYAGRFYDSDSAARRVDELNRKTRTSHAKVIQKDIPL